MHDVTLALDVGGTKIAYGLVADTNPREAIAVDSLPSQPAGGAILDQIATAVRRGLANAEEAGLTVVRVGAGLPGVVRAPLGEIVHNGPTIPGWSGSDVRGTITDQLPQPLPIAIHNDVRVWAYGEHRLGAGQRLKGRVLYISLGTGVGGAIIDDGVLLDGPTGSAGEVSEIVCADLRGIADRAENIASGNSLARYYNRLHEVPREQWLSLGRLEWSDPRPGDKRLPEVIDDPLTREIIDGNLRGLGRSIGALSSALDLSGVVLGGGVVGIGELVTAPLVAGIREACLVPQRDMPIVPSSELAHSPLLGAAALARDLAVTIPSTSN
ncbi:ROK family protein [Corynebacterium uterequi]|nr:ROK family protein [Corynebacterium uterequi]